MIENLDLVRMEVVDPDPAPNPEPDPQPGPEQKYLNLPKNKTKKSMF
jgi:hypothetical protein